MMQDELKMLELDVEGTKLKLEIKKYRQSTKENWDCEWCQIYILVQNRYINYEMNEESLLCCEVEEIHRKLVGFLSGETIEKCELSFIEPDFEMVIDTYEDDAILLDWKFNLWDDTGALSANSFTIVLDTEDITELANYLESIINKGGNH